MDCDKFESAMVDELYGELDELTSAAAKRHIAGCARCAALLGGLRATRRVASVPLVDPPADLEQRILSAARDVHPFVPLRRRVAQAISLAGRWAMRPQTAMAAVFLVMIGTSVLLLRGKASPAPDSATVTVTEKGSPAPEASAAPEQTAGEQAAAASRAAVLASAAPAAAAPVVAAPAAEMGGAAGRGGPSRPASLPADAKRAGAEPSFDAALQLYRSGRFDDATRAFDALAASDVGAELWAARSVREGKGCRAAVARFDRLAQHASGSAAGWDALLEGALCYRAVGDLGDARTRLTRLLQVGAYADRARAELDRLDRMQAAPPPAMPAAPAAHAARAAPKADAPATSPPSAHVPQAP
jgi:hypothetical protein